MTRPPLELSVQIVDSHGAVTRWGSEDHDPKNIPRNLSFRTQLMQGFADATVVLRRRIDQDFVDLHLFDDVSFVGADGSVAYEGRLGAMPRSYDTSHTISLQLAGWMAHGHDRPFREIYVDRGWSGWQPASAQNRVALVSGGYGVIDPQTVPDETTGQPSLLQEATGPWSANGKPHNIARYSGNGIPIGSVYYAEKLNSNISTADTHWNIDVHVGDDDLDTASTYDTSANLRASSPTTGTLTATTTTRRFARLAAYYDTGPIALEGVPFDVFWTCVAVYGQHGLAKRGTATATTAQGFYASDVITNIAQRWCPRLSVAGIQPTSFVIPHLVFADLIDPYDAFLAINAFHLYDLSVWENKTLHYQPTDLTDYDWEVRLSDPGVSVDLQGASTADLANGIVVQFQNLLTGTSMTLTPDNTAALADTSVDNPANQHGLKVWTKYQLSIPATPDSAVQIGRAALADFNAPKAPGSIKVSHHVKDRAGHWQQGWKVRAGDRVAITDHPNDSPRLVHETTWDHDSKTLTISVDAPARQLDAVLDRMQTALTAAGLQ